MVAKATGFLTRDGTFFEKRADAILYDFTQDVQKLCESHKVAPNVFFKLLDSDPTTVKGYINAKQAITTASQRRTAAAPDINIPDDE